MVASNFNRKERNLLVFKELCHGRVLTSGKGPFSRGLAVYHTYPIPAPVFRPQGGWNCTIFATTSPKEAIWLRNISRSYGSKRT
jgi:hypothetical protein